MEGLSFGGGGEINVLFIYLKIIIKEREEEIGR